MKHVLLDTHAWAWSLAGDIRLSAKATATIEAAENVYISPISLFEIGQKVRLGKWPQMKPFLSRLPGLIDAQGGRVAELSPAIALAAATLEWAHRDPFDRILGATAINKGFALVSADGVFDELSDEPGWCGRIW